MAVRVERKLGLASISLLDKMYWIPLHRTMLEITLLKVLHRVQ